MTFSPSQPSGEHRLTLVLLFLTVSGCGHASKEVAEIKSSATDAKPATAIAISEDDWPWWRGANRDNVAQTGTNVPTEFGDSKNVIWKTNVPGQGHSSATVVADQIFLCSADQQQETQMVLSYDRATGKSLWNTTVHQGSLPGSGNMHPKSTHANGSPACDGQSVFATFLNGEQITLTSLSLDGQINWTKELGFFNAKFGYAPSPCLYESLIIVSGDNRGGSFLAAVHRETGNIVWRIARSNQDTYSSATIVPFPAGDQLIISGDRKVISYNPNTAEENWTCEGTAQATCGTVVWWNNLVFASGGYPQRETIAVDINTGEKVWSDEVKCYEQSMLVVGDHLYAVTDDGIAICRDAATGKRTWRERLAGPISASPVLVGNNIYATNEKGATWVFQADPKQYQQVAKNQLGTSGFASLSICGDRIYARTTNRANQGILYCIGNP
ncbi:MAG: PQQ-binding-like beta-propeller repeat protein [Fuerstiella sp.]